MELTGLKEHYLEAFEKSNQKPFVVTRVDDHVFIKFNKKEVHFWSPQLHLELVQLDEKNCRLHGLFGPNPMLWTFFMFLHFGVATLFIILAIWAYSSAILDQPYGIQVGLMVLMVVLWIAFYVFGRLGKRQGRPQMQRLYEYMIEVLL